jgi:signal transduction histidine kinase
LINRVVDELRLVHPDREVAIELPEQEMTGQWDEDRLSQLVENLVANALRHGPAGRPVSVTLARDGDAALLCVANAGHIDAELLPQLFDPFRSGAGRRPSGADEGLGLGLYIVRQIAAAHGGSVTAATEAGTVRFTVRLPIAS